MIKPCAVCGGEFDAIRRAVFCSTKCRGSAVRARDRKFKRQIRENAKESVNLEKRRWHAKHAERVNEKRRTKWRTNQEAIAAKRRQYYAENIDREKLRQRKYRERNQERLRFKHSEYSKTHRNRLRETARIRHTKRVAALAILQQIDPTIIGELTND